MNDISGSVRIEPLTTSNWDQFVELFGRKGACCNCWCMYYRLTKSEYEEGRVDDLNKKRMNSLVRKNKPAGLIGFLEDKPAAWCALAPREDFTRLERSRIHKRIDDKPVWSIPCLFIKKEFRHKGLSLVMLKGAIEFARDNNIGILEGYPVIPGKHLPDTFIWTGLLSTFEKAGFEVADVRSRNRPMVRFYTRD